MNAAQHQAIAQIERGDRRLIWLLHSAALFIIALLFLLIVMTAVAQQEVISSIKQQQLTLGYGAALSINSEAKAKRDSIRRYQVFERTEFSRLGGAQVRFKEAQRHWEDSWVELQPYIVRLERPCGLTLPKEGDFNDRIAVLSDLRQCQAAAGSANSQLLASSNQPAVQFAQASLDYRKKFDEFSMIKDKLEAAHNAEIAIALSPDEAKVNSSFSDMDVLFSNWMLIGGMLGLFPPALLQILLTFFSGLFGAVLVTLVLIVYPHTDFNITASKETWSRILLGGLVALCVYIVLLGGTAVVGAGSGMSGAGTNYMAFCGIGILAGMFSDRVAFWLSARANTFFKPDGGPLPAQPAPATGQPKAP